MMLMLVRQILEALPSEVRRVARRLGKKAGLRYPIAWHGIALSTFNDCLPLMKYSVPDGGMLKISRV